MQACHVVNMQSLAMFKPNEAAYLLAERFNMIGWIYK